MKKIVLVSPFALGHHLGFMQLFSQILINNGNQVFALFPEPELLDEWQIKNKIPASKLINLRYTDPEPIHFRLGRFNGTLNCINKWIQLKKKIREIEKKNATKIDFVFFEWLDTFLSGFLLPHLLDMLFPYYWSGLFFHPWYLSINTHLLKEKVGLADVDLPLLSKNCFGIALHDRTIIEKFRQRLNGKSVIFFPETADDSAPDLDHPLAREIKLKAKGRTTIGLIGLTFYKGLTTLIQVAQSLPDKDFFFVIIGSINYLAYPEDQQIEIKSFFSQPPENCFVSDKDLKEGIEFNSVFYTFDIPFIVYDNFPSTSNNLTKAAILKKPVIASKGYIIGADVEYYKLGITVEQGNVDQCREALYALKKQIFDKSIPEKNFVIYSKEQSIQKLNNSFITLLGLYDNITKSN